MEYVADELGVARAQAARAAAASSRFAPTSAAIRAPVGASSARAGRTSCTRTPPRPVPPAGSRPCFPGRARPRRPSSTPTTATSSAATSAAAGSASSARIERLLAYATRHADRRQRRGARRPRRVRRRDRPTASSSSPTASTCRRGARRTSSASARSGASSGWPRRRSSIGWAGRLTAIKRPLDLVRTLRAVSARMTSTRCSCSSGTASCGVTPRRSRGSSASPTAAALRRLPAADPRLVRGLRRLAAHLGERGDAGRRDRVARGRAARRRDARGRHGDRRRATARAATCSRSATSPAWPRGWRARPRPGAARGGSGDAGAADVRDALRDRAHGRRDRGRLPSALAVKVLHLHKLTGVSGSEGHLLALLPALRERGHRRALSRP